MSIFRAAVTRCATNKKTVHQYSDFERKNAVLEISASPKEAFASTAAVRLLHNTVTEYTNTHSPATAPLRPASEKQANRNIVSVMNFENLSTTAAQFSRSQKRISGFKPDLVLEHVT
ncbi:hypothetical protein [Burkholderia pseudomallei]|uniref:hypothetical protein n=1 Tax=Burkholderia pseudomallei TaxID=28450 RepID=UPI000A7C79E9|nr:hypothetical protein [Burkholderia pseudomallei]